MGASIQSRKKGSRRGAMSEINVTPFVDVMLVLLIIFMVTAPMLTVGVSVDLPEADAESLPGETKPTFISIDKNSRIFVGDDEVSLDGLSATLTALAAKDKKQPLFVRGDGKANYEAVAKVLAIISKSGITNVSLVTESEK